jgi:hypothetical protein
VARATAPGIVLVLWERVHPVGWSFSRIATAFLSDVRRSSTSTITKTRTIKGERRATYSNPCILRLASVT